LSDIGDRLRRDRLVDETSMLKPGGKREILAAIESQRAKGRDAYVLFARGVSLDETWKSMNGDETRELLLVFDGQTMSARGWGLDAPRIARALEAAQPALREYHGKGLAHAIDELGSAAGEAPQSHAIEIGAVGVAAVLAVGGIAWIVRRRARIARESRVKFDEARASAEKAYAEVILVAEELGDARELQLEAAALKKRLDDLVEKGPPDDPVVIGSITQLENELAVLRSTNLQRGRSHHAEVEDHRRPPERGDTAAEGDAGVGEDAVRRGGRST
jgi:hypothetical protein